MTARIAVAMLLAALAAACSNAELADKKSAQTANAAAIVTAQEARQPIRANKQVFLGRTRVASAHGDLIPESFEGPQGFVWTPPPADRLTLAQIAARITKFTGLGVNIEEGGALPAGGEAGGPPAVVTPAAATRDPAIETINDLIRETPAQPGNTAKTAPQAEHLDPYVGPLSGFLATVSTLFGRDWEIHGRTIYFSKFLLRVYAIDDLNSDTTSVAGLTGAAGSAGSSGGAGGSASGGTSGTSSGSSSSGGGLSSGQNINTTTSVKPWEEVLKTVEMLAGEKNVTPAPASHEITVRCPRLCQEQVREYVRNHNREISRTVHLVVAIRGLQDTGSDEYAVNPILAYQNLGFSLAVNPAGTGSGAGTQSALIQGTNGLGSIVTSILNPPAGSTAAHFSGSSLSLQALSQLNKTTSGITKEAFVSNDRPFALRNAQDITFVSQSNSNTSTTLATTSASLTTLIIGDQLQILPHLTKDGRIRLSLALSQTSILRTDVLDLGNGITSQVPQLNDDATAPVEFTLRDGQTIILTDVSTRTSSDVEAGSCGLSCYLLGGSTSASNAKMRTFVVITAEESHAGDADVSTLGERAE